MLVIEAGTSPNVIREILPRNRFSADLMAAPSPPVRVSSVWRSRARKSLPQMKEGDAHGCTQIGPRGSWAVGHAFDLQAWVVEIRRQSPVVAF